MDPTEFDVPAWFRRAEHFVRGLHGLPGRWGISIKVAPPIASSDFSLIEAEFSYELPSLLRKLYTEGSAEFSCCYSWTPDTKHLPQVNELVPHHYSFYGGPKFIPLANLPRSIGVENWFDAEGMTDDEKGAAITWEQTLPIIFIENGDLVGIHFTGNPDSQPVVYLCHDDPKNSVEILAENLQSFLIHWEQLAYIGPEIWLLDHFLCESSTGSPGIDDVKAGRWRKLLQAEY
jgi:hypothetical protein